MPSAMMAANPAIGAAGRPQPQTSQQAPGGPFLRHARTASRPGYARSGDTLSQQITNGLAAAPGYLRYLDCTFVASGGTSTAAVVAAGDAPYSLVSFIQFKDPWGTPLITGDGYSCLYLLNKYAGQGIGALYPSNTISQLPSFSAIQTASGTGAGNFTFKSVIPCEGTKGYGVISIGNSSVLPSLTLQLGGSAAVYGTAPGTAPTVATTVDEFYYDVDPAMPVEPPGNGSTFQTSVVIGNQPIGSTSSTRVQLPRTGGYLTNLILVLRDSTGARVNAWNSTGRIRLYIDGVPRYDETYLQVIDRMYADTNGASQDSGVINYSFKRSLSQHNLGLLDTLEQALQTNPGTLIEVEMTPWGTIANSPAQLQAIITQLVPSGSIEQGLPEV